MAYKKKTETFTQIPDWYWQCGLDIYEVNIIARIASWQRANKKFFESYDFIAKTFNTSYNTIRFRFEKLEKAGILKRNGKKGRSWMWIVDSNKLNSLKDSIKREQNTAGNYQEVTDILSPDNSYNTNNINNNIIDEREPFEGSLSVDQKAFLALKDI